MLTESNDSLIYPRLTLMLAMCLTFIIRMRRIPIFHADHHIM